MTREEIQDGETRMLEFKKELPQDSSKWIKTIVAFANGAGGKFIIGITNQLQVEGLSKDESIFSLRDKIADVISQKCSPQIMFDIYPEDLEGKTVLVVEVFPGNDTPYFIKSMGKENGTFIRLNATTRNADFTTIDELELRKKRRYYDELPFTELEVTQNDINYLCADFSRRAKKGRSSIRNKVISEVCERLDLIEGCGTGIKRIIDLCVEQGVEPPEFVEIGDLLRVNFYRPSYKKMSDKSSDKVAINDETADKMSDKDVQRMSTILDYLKTHDSITSDLTATLLAVEQKTANRLLTKAVSLKILAPHGANKNRTYSLKKDDE